MIVSEAQICIRNDMRGSNDLAGIHGGVFGCVEEDDTRDEAVVCVVEEDDTRGVRRGCGVCC